MFASHLAQAEQFAALLSDAGVVRGLIGPREVPRLWERHLVNCALLGEAIPVGVDVCDIGSGAGLPGIVLALQRPDLSVTLVEPLLRRTAFLEEAVSELGLGNVDVVRARAEELHGKRDFAVVTSRAVAPLDRLLRWSLPLVREGGEMVAMKGSSIHEEIVRAAGILRELGAGAVRVELLGAGVTDPPTTVVRVEAPGPSALGWADARGPRRGTPRSRPTRPGTRSHRTEH